MLVKIQLCGFEDLNLLPTKRNLRKTSLSRPKIRCESGWKKLVVAMPRSYEVVRSLTKFLLFFPFCVAVGMALYGLYIVLLEGVALFTCTMIFILHSSAVIIYGLYIPKHY